MPSEVPPRRGHPQPLTGGPIRFGPYWLDARIAVGGTAEVYLARPLDPRQEPQRLIVKRLLPHFAGDDDGRTMFEREAALHAAVKHENVVTVFGSGVNEEGEPYLAMEYVDGVDGYRLLRRMKQEGRAPLRRSRCTSRAKCSARCRACTRRRTTRGARSGSSTGT